MAFGDNNPFGGFPGGGQGGRGMMRGPMGGGMGYGFGPGNGFRMGGKDGLPMGVMNWFQNMPTMMQQGMHPQGMDPNQQPNPWGPGFTPARRGLLGQ